ncbi:ABC transporter ATP-binding protein [Vibrio metschnikovii]|uniref:ABC transporter ATP-binding protein n=3 Tax=Unclassified Bacteria TaxID=49928 RepID=A0AAU6SWJ9_UNCXX|nr:MULTISPECIES: ABC transporter ATP-binding protein [Vibrio]EKO3558398.1 ABC transporter ATP-binding protein [Vibrio metschnikovii]EKO3568390.1 ABC transporter ATP-binding protein [Vibrio metschnikovii]EKO3579953.1 ABC transporter ATP-binding protein [Vibrio metschnikovii]EKO3585624.1 ABC transporter ATP-binding protein [Vibrio metschnikovii]EKO3596555.1 ABC transporter ATP-binding protein [Vibrio metschnikovii]
MNSQPLPSATPVIDLIDVQFQWPNNPQPTLHIDALSVLAKQHLFIKGPSGCGKSTLLSLLTGINTATQGHVHLLGHDLAKLKSRQRDKFRADNIGYIFQQFNLLPYLSVIDNVILPCQFSAHRRANVSGDIRERAKQLLAQLKLSDTLLNKPVTELSIGQQQRVAAARALIGDPPLLIADEPTSALDYDNRSAFIELLLDEANRVGTTLVFVSHDPTLEKLFERSVYLPTINQARGVA